MNVQLSTSRLRTTPGMGDHTGCYVCGRHGHWSKDCPVGRDGSYGSYGDDPRGRSGRGPPPPPHPGYGPRGGYGMGSPLPAEDYMGGSAYSQGGYGGSMPPSRRFAGYGSHLGDRYRAAMASYAERSEAYDRSRLNSSVDYYEKYRVRPYGSSYFEERRMSYIPPPPPPPTSLPKLSSSIDPYNHQPMPLPSSGAAATAYYSRDRSPIRREPASAAGGYGYERTQLSPSSSRSIPPPPPSSSYSNSAVPRPKDPYAPRYTPY